MSRRAIQAAAIEKRASGRNLEDQIIDLAARVIITADLKNWATAVRWVGNDSAHPGGDSVTKADAEDILDLAEQFLNVIYVSPAKAQIHLAKRARGGKP